MDNPLMHQNLDDMLTTFLFTMLESFPFISVMFFLMIADVVIGIIAAVLMKQLSSNISWKGIGRKCITIVVVGICAVIGKVAKMPLAEMAAFGFCSTELISIMENCARAGVPFPDFVISILKKLRDDKGPITVTFNSPHEFEEKQRPTKKDEPNVAKPGVSVEESSEKR